MKALVIGATGLSGNALIKLLCKDERFSEIIAFSRRELGFQHPKLTKQIIDFNQLEEIKTLINGDILFSALGTTRKAAGSKENQYRVDFTYQYEFAHYAAENNVPNYALVSSMGADAQSKLFYPRIKGELEERVIQLPFKKIVILQPGPITGERERKRTMENLSVAIIRLFNKLGLLTKYQPALGSDIAKALIQSVLEEQSTKVRKIVLEEVLNESKKYYNSIN